MSSEERARAVDKLNVDCIIRPRNDNSALLTSQPGRQAALRSFFLDGICFAAAGRIGWAATLGAMCPCGE